VLQYLALIAIYLIIQPIAVRRGRHSPLWGVSAAALGLALQYALEHLWSGNLLQSFLQAFLLLVVIAPAAALALVLAVLLMLPPRQVRRAPKSTRIPYRAIGWFLIVGAFVLPLGNLASLFLQSVPVSRVSMVQPGLTVLGSVIAIAALVSFRMAARARVARQQWLEDRRPPVFLLRSFRLDAVKLPIRRWLLSVIPWQGYAPDAPFDGHISQAIERRLGPFVALGDPEDYLPEVGANRLYPGDESWQAAFKDIASRAQRFLILEGNTDGLVWELAWLRRHVQPEKVFVATPPEKFHAKSGPTWRALVRAVGPLGYSIPASDPGPGCVFQLDHQWTARRVRQDAEAGEDYAAALSAPVPGIDGTMPPDSEEDLPEDLRARLDDVLSKPPQAPAPPTQRPQVRTRAAGLLAASLAAIAWIFWPPEPTMVSLPDHGIGFTLPSGFSPPEYASEPLWLFSAPMTANSWTAEGRDTVISLATARYPYGEMIPAERRIADAKDRVLQSCGGTLIEATASTLSGQPAEDLRLTCQAQVEELHARARIAVVGRRLVTLMMGTTAPEVGESEWTALADSLEVQPLTDPPRVLPAPRTPYFYYHRNGEIHRFEAPNRRDQIAVDHVSNVLAIESNDRMELAFVGSDQILWTLDTRAGEIRRGPTLTTQQETNLPARGRWSPRGDLLAIHYQIWIGIPEIEALNPYRGLYVMTRESRAVRHVPEVKYFIDWWRDGDVIHEKLEPDGTVGLYAYSVQAGSERLITRTRGKRGFVGLHRVGDRAVYPFTVQADPDIFGQVSEKLVLIDLDDGTQEDLTETKDSAIGSPRLSPDGTKVLYTYCPPKDQQTSMTQFLQEGAQPTCLLNVLSLEDGSQWSTPVEPVTRGHWLDSAQIITAAGRTISLLTAPDQVEELVADGYLMETW
jgi:hypothetical protein